MSQPQSHAKVTKAKAEDASELGTFILGSWKEAGPHALGWVGANDETINELASPPYLQRRISRRNSGILVARKGGEIVGFVANRKIDEREVELTGVIVLRGKEGLAVGSELLLCAKAAAAKSSYRKMIVRTEADNNRAITFYKSNGFVELGKVEEMVDGERVAFVELAVELS